MAKISDEFEKRDFIADEITKRIVGPGFAQDIYLCAPDASDEILTERPQVVYTSGILFPKSTQEATGDSSKELASDVDPGNLFGDPYSEFNSDSSQIDADQRDEVEHVGEDASQGAVFASSEEMENGLSDERAGFKPDRIGLITCLKSQTQSVAVHVNYGRYHLVREEEWVDCIKVRLDQRCPIDVLQRTFDYYDQSAQELLHSLGVRSVRELFFIDEENKTISPRRALSVQKQTADGNYVTKYIYASSFPALPQNIAAAIVWKLLSGEKTKIELTGINWTNLQEWIGRFDSWDTVVSVLKNAGWDSLSSHIQYDEASNTVGLVNGSFKSGEISIANCLFVFDPVRDYVLDKLLEYRFFKRENISLTVTLDLSKDSGDLPIGNDDMVLYWKAFHYRNSTAKRYLRILVQNAKKVSPRSGQIPHAFQTELILESDGILPYSEPQVSRIDDEFNLNEVIYSDEVVFGKGVNCAVCWEENAERSPAWIKTTYAPSTIVRAFSTKPASHVDDIHEICTVHNLSIWGLPDNIVIAGLRRFARYYKEWMDEQHASAQGESILQPVLDDQRAFYERLVDNIDYLAGSPRAFWCFRMANAAMYIQMLLGRDKMFRNKGRDKSDYNSQDSFYKDCWNYFRDANQPSEHPSYYPFQLAFLVMNVKSSFEARDPYRTDKVDLIWFPTGGGKTEAYLALTALTIAERRSSGHSDTDGVSVIMRYTLRLLTAQQFERASYLICALEFLREQSQPSQEGYSLGDKPITLGLWIGQATTPNRISELISQDKFKSFFATKKKDINPFPVVYCPWCGCELVGDDKTSGYDKGRGGIRLNDICLNAGCHFHKGLPIYYIDEQLYQNPPTLLFATVDKFAQLNDTNSGKLFGIGTTRRKPDLIIQDELHLISGPLGSLVGLFESLVEELATERDTQGNVIRTPKIIASTATTRNTAHLISQLYERKVISFPSSGIRYGDNFFSHIVPKNESKRRYLGFSPTGHTASELEIRTISAELVAKEKLITEWLIQNGTSFDNEPIYNALSPDGKLTRELDLYWTQVLYYVNLKSLGRTHSRFSQEIKATVENMRRFSETYPQLSFVLDGFYTRNTEFTSRQNSAQIKRLLIKANDPTMIERPQPEMLRVESPMDVVQATNMISVGIDIDRWNIMIMVGQPLTTSEYIQASSRAGRHHQGLIVNLYNPLRSRELSYYENYMSYHQVFYKFVEPLSVTTFTEMTLDKLLMNLYVGYMVLIKKKKKPNDVNYADKNSFIDWLSRRANAVGVQPSFHTSLQMRVDNIFKQLQSISTASRYFGELVTRVDLLPGVLLPHLMKNLRDVEQNTYLNYE